MDRDFLEGIDEHFERLMKQRRNGRRNGSRPSDPLLLEILDQLDELSSAQRQEVLTYIQSFRRGTQRS